MRLAAVLPLLALCGCAWLDDFNGFHPEQGITDAELDAGQVDAAQAVLDAGELQDAAAAEPDAATPDQVDAAQALDAGELQDAAADAAEPDAGPALPSCSDPGLGIYLGACSCSLTACACNAACSVGGAVACCDGTTLYPVCRCEL